MTQKPNPPSHTAPSHSLTDAEAILSYWQILLLTLVVLFMHALLFWWLLSITPPQRTHAFASGYGGNGAAGPVMTVQWVDSSVDSIPTTLQDISGTAISGGVSGRPDQPDETEESEDISEANPNTDDLTPVENSDENTDPSDTIQETVPDIEQPDTQPLDTTQAPIEEPDPETEKQEDIESVMAQAEAAADTAQGMSLLDANVNAKSNVGAESSQFEPRQSKAGDEQTVTSIGDEQGGEGPNTGTGLEPNMITPDNADSSPVPFSDEVFEQDFVETLQISSDEDVDDIIERWNNSDTSIPLREIQPGMVRELPDSLPYLQLHTAEQGKRKWIQVRFLVDSKGQVIKKPEPVIQRYSGNEAMDEKIINDIAMAQFQPFTYRGQPSYALVTLVLTYE